MLPIVIVGLGSAGYAALTTIKKINPKEKITIIDEKDNDLFHPCGLPYALEGKADDEKLVQNIFLNKMGVEKIKGKALYLDTDLKKIIYFDKEQEKSLSYKKVIICTGSYPLMPPISGIKEYYQKKIFHFSILNDLMKLKNEIKGKKNTLVIGAGAIGLETAFALSKNGLSVNVADIKEHVLPGIIDSDISKILENYLSEMGIKFLLGHKVDKIYGNSEFEGFVVNEKEFGVDFGVVATGFLPDISIAENSKLKYNKNGIQVNSALQTSNADIYAAGDCVSNWSVITKQPLNIRLATSAYKMGIIAGKNVCGRKIFYQGTAGTFVSKVGDYEISGTGFSKEQAARAGFFPVVGKIKMDILPEYFINNTEIIIKVIANKEDGKLLGAQAIGLNGAAARINIISAALEFGISLDQLENLELAYCPAISEVHDPLFKAIDFLQRRIKK